MYQEIHTLATFPLSGQGIDEALNDQVNWCVGVGIGVAQTGVLQMWEIVKFIKYQH